MNEQQRKFKIELISDYEEEIRKTYFQINRNGLFTFLGVGMVIAIFGVEAEFTSNEVMDNVVGILSAATAITNATVGTKRIISHENMKKEVRLLEVDLANDELEHPELPKVYSKKLQDKKFKL